MNKKKVKSVQKIRDEVKGSYDHLHLNPRNEQIKILENNATPEIGPHIKKAYNILVGDNKLETKNEEVIEAIFSVAVYFADNPDADQGSLNLPEGSMVLSESIKKIFPFIKRIRRELFSKENAPFPNNPKGALRWLRNEVKKEDFPIEQMKMQNEDKIKKIKDEINKKILELAKLTPQIPGLHYENKWLTFPGQNKKREAMWVWPGTLLGKLEEDIKKLSEFTNFDKDSLLIFILTGIKPLMPIYNITSTEIRGGSLLNRIITIDIYKALKEKEIKYIYHRIKKSFGKEGRVFLGKKHQELYNLVEKYGGVPYKNKGDFWIKIQKEWNKKHPENKFTSSNSPRVSYQRMKKRLKIEPLKPVSEN